jgi:sugar/nucleoside kinase (ribokinase family)
VPGARSIAVVGSANIDLVGRCRRLPCAGDTARHEVFERIPGGPANVDAVHGTAAGDAFCAALVVFPREAPQRAEALRRGCAPGAPGARRMGARPSLPRHAETDEILGR